MLVLGGSGLFERCTFAGNEAALGGGAIYADKHGSVHLVESTFWGNLGSLGAIICGELYVECICENTIIAFSNPGRGLVAYGNAEVELVCCDIYGNAGGDWVGEIADQYGINGNISEDPLFCDPEEGDFTLDEASSCASFTPPNEECDQIGAWPIGCGGSPVTTSTWGGIKAIFQR